MRSVQLLGVKVLSALASDHVQRPRNCGPLENADRIGRFGSEGGGPYMILWLVLQGDRIAKAAYSTYGCPSAIACASLTAQLVTGRTTEQALKLERDDLMVVLGNLPAGKEHCADMAIHALKSALGSADGL